MKLSPHMAERWSVQMDVIEAEAMNVFLTPVSPPETTGVSCDEYDGSGRYSKCFKNTCNRKSSKSVLNFMS